jgi:hypothetical protein
LYTCRQPDKAILLLSLAAAAKHSRTVFLIMMKTAAVVLLAFLASASAVPAVVWKTGNSQSVFHSSENVPVADFLAESFASSRDSALPLVVFIVGRSPDGSESLTTLASGGSLPGVSSKYSDAHCIHHHVTGVEGPNTVASAASQLSSGNRVVQISLSEFNSKLSSLDEPIEVEVTESGMVSKAVKNAGKRARALAESNVLVVKIEANADPAAIDSAVVSAIAHPKVGSVVLSAVRSVAEVKLERHLASYRRVQSMQESGSRMLAAKSRRLAGDDDANANNNVDLSGVYYVSITPNILAGILFFALFSFTTWIGISCMGMISGQDVFVSKMPSIGREA